ncbi:MAG: DUF115 domain-containing protein [Alphaproteobacteria bacterium]
MSDTALFKQNLKILAPYLSKTVADVLQTHRNRHVKVLGEPGSESLNLATPSGPIYQPNAVDYCRGQVARFLESPRLIALPEYLAGTENRRNLAAVIAAHISGMDYSVYGRGSADFGVVGSLVSFGLGLGVHVQDLYTRLPCRDLIILEPEFEFFVASLHAIDWSPIVEQCEARGGKIHFLLERDPNTAYDALALFMRDHSYGLIEGTYLFDHYRHKIFPSIVQRLYQSGANLLSYNGWAEDETTHVVNHAENAARNIGKLLPGRPALGRRPEDQPNPAVVVGSGPSLNATIDLIRDRRDRITLFTAGTSLGAVLKAGLKPDFHCELENVDVVPDMIGNLKQQYDLSGVSLVASTTVHPAVPPLFDDSIFFFREGEALMRRLSGSYGQIDMVGPSGVNTAVTIAGRMGYRQIVLFGADFGVPIEGPRYAAGVAYDDIDKINSVRLRKGLSPTTAAGSVSSGMNRVVPGNAEMDVKSNDTLIGMRHRLEACIKTMDADVYNVGNGARIIGSKPCDAARFHVLTENIAPRQERQTGKMVLSVEKGTLFHPEDIEEIETGFEQVFDALEVGLDRLIASADTLTIERVYDDISRLMYFPLSDTGPAKTRAVRAAMTGSLLRIFHMLRSHCARIAEPHKDRYLRDALGLVRGMGAAWRASVLYPIRDRRIELVNGSAPRQTPLQTVLHRIRQTQSDVNWPLEDAIAEFQGNPGADHLVRYILKENTIQRLHNDRVWPAFDGTLARLVHEQIMQSEALDRFIFPGLALLAIDPSVRADTRRVEDVKALMDRRQAPGVHLLFYAGVFFLNAGCYGDAKVFAGRALEQNGDDAGIKRLWANVLLMNGELEEALAMYRSTEGEKIILRVTCAVIDLEPVAAAIVDGLDAGIEACGRMRDSSPSPSMIDCVAQVLLEKKTAEDGGCDAKNASDLDRDYLSVVRSVVLDAFRNNQP